MFGFGKVKGLHRKSYDARVVEVLEREMGIDTDGDRNLMFPGFLRFADLVAQGWHRKLGPEFNALAIGISYLDGASLADETGRNEARRILPLIRDFLDNAQESGAISAAEKDMFFVPICDVSDRLK